MKNQFVSSGKFSTGSSFPPSPGYFSKKSTFSTFLNHIAIVYTICFSTHFLQVITMSNIWRPVDYDYLSSQVNQDNEEISCTEISSEEDADSFGLASNGK